MLIDTNDENVTKKINSIVETNYGNDSISLETLQELSTFYKENSQFARKNLRSQIELRNIKINEDFLNSFSKIKTSFDQIHQTIACMNDSVNSIVSRLQEIKIQNKMLIDKTQELKEFSKNNDLEKEVVDLLLAKHQLKPEEKNILHGPLKDSSCISEIFNALNSIQLKKHDSRLLMKLGCQNLASDILEQMDLYQEGFIERLYRWTHNECRNFDLNSDLIIEALSRLQERPVLFKNIFDEYCSARRSIVVRRFIDALTIGENDTKPIELYSHDPQKYVGDMLAWLNSIVPNEEGQLKALLKNCNKVNLDEYVLNGLMNIMEGIVHPLKTRIEKILTIPSPSTTLYSVTNLIRFFRRSIEIYIKDGLLVSLLKDMQILSENNFFDALQTQVLTALAKLESTPRDLSPSPTLKHMLIVLQEMLSTASMIDDSNKDMKKIASCVLDPLLHAINEQVAKLSTINMSTYLLNCYFSIQNTLSSFNNMENYIEKLQAMCEAQIDTLTSEQANHLVANLDLGQIYTILQSQIDSPLSEISGMKPIYLKHFMDKLEVFLDLSDSLILPQILLLVSEQHKDIVKKRSFEIIDAVYRQLYYQVHDTKNLYQNPSELMQIHPDTLSEKLNLKLSIKKSVVNKNENLVQDV